MNKRHFFYSLLMIILLIVAVAGWIAVDYLGNEARKNIIAESQASISTLSVHLSATFTGLEVAVKSLAGSPWIAPALISKRDRDIEQANSALDRYNSALNASVSYLMDADGMTVASSNRKDPDSFVGKSYQFRPYFQKAAEGQPGRYFALGITSGKRGFYVSYPVQNLPDKVLGVVTMKKDLDEMEIFFSRYPFCFLVSPDGIIFLSSSSAMVLKSLWPLNKAVRDNLIASRQFGDKISEPVFKEVFADDMEITLEGKDYLYSRKVFDRAGWSVVLLTPADRIMHYKLMGILTTIFVCLLIMGIAGIVYLNDRSLGAVRQSEEKYRLLFNSAGDAIFVIDTEARMLAVNLLACERLGYTHAELMSMTINQVDSQAEAQHVMDRVTRLMEHGHLTFETVQQRKDGLLIPTEVIARRISWEGQPAIMSICRDITDRKRAEEKLRESEKKYREMYDFVPIPVYEMDFAAKLTSVNRAVYETFGGTEEDLKKGVSAWNLSSPDDIDKSRKNIERLLKGEKIGGTEYNLTRLDGSVFPAIAISTIIYGDGKPVGIRGAIVDITERKRAEETLRKSEERQKRERDRLELILKTAQDGFWLVDASTGHLIDVNEAASLMLGYTREELLARALTDIDAQWSPEELGREMQKIKTTGHALFETRQRTKGGQIINVEISVNYLQETDQFFSFIRNITGRKQAEEAIKNLGSYLNQIINRVGDPIFVKDQQLRFVLVNQALCTFLGKTEEELLGTTGYEYLPKEEMAVFEKQDKLVLATGEDNINEEKLTDGEGKTHTIITKKTLYIDIVGNKQIVGVIRDITERKQAEEVLEEERRRLQQALDEIRTLRGIVPICANCKKIRDDKGYWNQVEKYVSDHTEAKFSHSICPDCLKKLYPEEYKKIHTDGKL